MEVCRVPSGLLEGGLQGNGGGHRYPTRLTSICGFFHVNYDDTEVTSIASRYDGQYRASP